MKSIIAIVTMVVFVNVCLCLEKRDEDEVEDGIPRKEDLTFDEQEALMLMQMQDAEDLLDSAEKMMTWYRSERERLVKRDQVREDEF